MCTMLPHLLCMALCVAYCQSFAFPPLPPILVSCPEHWCMNDADCTWNARDQATIHCGCTTRFAGKRCELCAPGYTGWRCEQRVIPTGWGQPTQPGPTQPPWQPQPTLPPWQPWPTNPPPTHPPGPIPTHPPATQPPATHPPRPIPTHPPATQPPRQGPQPAQPGDWRIRFECPEMFPTTYYCGMNDAEVYCDSPFNVRFYRCDCSGGYSGPRCQTPPFNALPGPGFPGGNGGGIPGTLPPLGGGYIPPIPQINDCRNLSLRCLNDFDCTQVMGVFKCVCDVGFAGSRCETIMPAMPSAAPFML